MKVYDKTSVARKLAKTLKKPVLFLHFPVAYNFNLEEICKAVPYLNTNDNDVVQAMSDGYAFIVCDSDRERERLFALTVGDDGPTKLNKYGGKVKVYALTIDRTGKILNENT